MKKKAKALETQLIKKHQTISEYKIVSSGAKTEAFKSSKCRRQHSLGT